MGEQMDSLAASRSMLGQQVNIRSDATDESWNRHHVCDSCALREALLIDRLLTPLIQLQIESTKISSPATKVGSSTRTTNEAQPW